MPCPKGPCEPKLTFTDKLTGALVATAPLPWPGCHPLWLGGDMVFYSGFNNGDTFPSFRWTAAQCPQDVPLQHISKNRSA